MIMGNIWLPRNSTELSVMFLSTGRQIDWSYSEEALQYVDIMCSELESKILYVIHHSVPISVQKTTKEGIPIRKVSWEGS